MNASCRSAILMILGASALIACGMPESPPGRLAIVENVVSKPLLAQALRVEQALNYLESALASEDSKFLKSLQEEPHSENTARAIQEILDPYTIAMLDINPEGRVRVLLGPAQRELIQSGWTTFLVKVHNRAGSNEKLIVRSPNSEPIFHASSSTPRPKAEHELTSEQIENRFLELSMYQNPPLQAQLSGMLLEYAIVQFYSKVSGKHEVQIGFGLGQDAQSIGSGNTIDIPFDIRPSVRVDLEVKDDNGLPAMASFIITDGIERVIADGDAVPIVLDGFKTYFGWKMSGGTHVRTENYRNLLPHVEFQRFSEKLTGLYPLPSRRLAAVDEYPDFYFQPQIFRQDGEHVHLAPGTYTVTYTRGPEYITQAKQITVPEGVDTFDASFRLKRWIDLAREGWYSSDHHIHASGCTHYESPSEGVDPEHMIRQIQGRDLNYGGVLSFSPSWYHQKQFFTGEVDSHSTSDNILRYDVETSGFPSGHSGHLSLLNLSEDDYPNTDTIEDWPSWSLPVLEWAKSQGGIAGYAHSGWGLEPNEATDDLPNYVTPKMDYIGANEYIVTVTYDLVDFYSTGDTPVLWELNMWYQTLNLGYTTRLSGESDFPCLYDEYVGVGRSYTKLDGELNFPALAQAIVNGRSYVTDGRSHIVDFFVDGVEMGVGDSKLALAAPKKVSINARVAAYLPAEQTMVGAEIAGSRLTDQPYWHLERARIEQSRKVPVELIVNGEAVASTNIEADGKWKNIHFDYEIEHSSWVALRILASSHSNPIFVTVSGNPILSRRSAEWAQRAVDQAWKTKSPQIRKSDREAAKDAYDRARAIYAQMEKDALYD